MPVHSLHLEENVEIHTKLLAVLMLDGSNIRDQMLVGWLVA